MSNFELQEFKSAFEVSFPAEIADMVLAEMEMTYGSLFGEKYGNIDYKNLVFQVRKVLDGVTPQDLKTGLQRMKSEKWCPSLPEFRSWCVSDAWWSANEAWAKAMQYVDYPQTKITVLTKQTLDEVHLILINEGQKSAGFAFRDIYTRLLNEAKSKNEVQQFYKPSKALAYVKKLSTHESQAYKDFSDDEIAIFERQKDFIKQGMSGSLAHQQALREYNALKNQPYTKMNKQVIFDEQRKSLVTPYHRMVMDGVHPVEAFKTLTHGVA